MNRLWLGLVLALALLAGVQSWRLERAARALEALDNRVAQEREARARLAAEDAARVLAKELKNSETVQGVADAFTQTQSANAARYRAELERAQRLLDGVHARAAGERAQAEAGAAACRVLADRANALDALVAQGDGLVAEGRDLVRQRDAEVALLKGLVEAYRVATEPDGL